MSFVPWLKFGGQEIANYNRTVSYISNGLLEDPRVQSAPGCGCDAIDEGPYESPAADEAPWYVAARPESGDFLGMILDRIEMNGPWARNVSARGGDGSVIGPQRLRGRVLSFRGILYAGSPQAMDYGKRWLSEALRNCDSTCGLGDLCLLPACPENEADTDRFFRTLKRAALIDGPVEVQIPNVPCDLITQMDWQMAAEVGYLYQDAEECLEETSITAGGSECCLLSTDEWIGDATAKIVVKAGGPNHVTDLLVKATPTKDGVCPADPLLDAEAFWTAEGYDGSSESLPDGTGNGHDAQLGSAAGVDANDPKWLPYDGEQHIYLPGVANNFVSTPDDAALDITGDIDIRFECALDDWTPASTPFLIFKNGGAGQISWWLEVLGTGVLRLVWSADGTAQLTADSTVATGFVDASRHWVRVTLDVNNGAAGRDIKFYTSEDGVTWTQLGATITQAGVTSIFNSTAALTISGNNQIFGKVYKAEIRNGIAGTVVADPDFTNKAQVAAPFATFVDSAGRTWTFSRATSGRKLVVVDRDLFLLGTDDRFEVPDHADLDFGATDEFTVMVAGRSYGTPAGGQAWLAKKNGLGVEAGYSLWTGSGEGDNIVFRIGDGAVSITDSLGSVTDGTPIAMGGVRRVGPDEIEVYRNGVGSGTPTSDTTTATLANAFVLKIGDANGNFADFEFFGGAVWRRALTADEMTNAMNALLGQATNEPTPCAEFTIDDLAPGHELIIDGSERTVQVREQLSGRVVGGLDVITPAEGLFQFIDIGACAEVCICLTANGEVNANTKVEITQFNRET